MRLESSWIQRFLAHQELVARVSPRTLDTHRSNLGQFWAWFSSNGAARLQPKLLGADYMAHLSRRMLSNTTVQSHLYSLNTLFRYLDEQIEEGAPNPFARIRRPKREPVRHPRIPRAEVQAAITAISRYPYADRGPCLAAMLEVFAHCGPRPLEVARLDLTDYRVIRRRDLARDDQEYAEEGTPEGLEIVHATIELLGKGDRLRTVPCPHSVIERLEAWLAVRGREDGPLFLTIHGRRYPVKCITPALRIAWILAGVPRRTCRDLRHFYATELFAGSRGNLAATQKALGHAYAVTTQRYVNPDAIQVEEAVRQAFG